MNVVDFRWSFLEVERYLHASEAGRFVAKLNELKNSLTISFDVEVLTR